MTTTERATTRVGSALLTVAAIGGALCIIFVVLAVVFHITLIMFKSGSMSPTIPTGSLAVVEQIAGADIAVGDVITVDRQDALPITHRVTSVAPLADGAVSITMRGDANPTEDPAPYVVTTARRVLFSVPGLAYAVSAASNPIALGGITIGAAAVVTWAFWPRGEAGRGEAGPGQAGGRQTGPGEAGRGQAGRRQRQHAAERRRIAAHTASRARHAATATGSTAIAGAAPGAIAYTGSDLAGPPTSALGALTAGLGLAFAARRWRLR